MGHPHKRAPHKNPVVLLGLSCCAPLPDKRNTEPSTRTTMSFSSLLFSGHHHRAFVLLALTIAVLGQPFARAFNSGAVVYWNGGGDSWDLTNAEWTIDPALSTGFSAWENSSSLSAVFNGPAGTITLADAITAGKLSFGSDGFTLTGNTLTLSGTFTSIDTDAGTQVISAPLAGGGTVFTKSGSGTLVLSGIHALSPTNQINLSGGTLEIRGEGTSLGVAGTATRIYIGTAGSGALTINSGGTLRNTYGIVGHSNGTGTVTVDGAGSTWTLTQSLTIGNTDSGTLTISNGGVLTDSGSDIGYLSQGSATVTGTGSTWNTKSMRIGVADSAEGQLTIKNGGAVYNTGSYIGMANGASVTASLLVTGEGSLLSGGLQVGNYGAATVLVNDGGKITGKGGSIGSVFGGTGSVTITGANSSWAMTSTFTMDNTSALTISDGAAFTTGGSLIGNAAGSISTITLSGTGSSWVDSSSVVIGYDGSANLNIGEGTNVSTASWLRLGQNNSAQGTIIQTGGTLDVGTYFQFNKGTLAYRLEGGTLKVGDTSVAGILTGTGAYTFELAGGTLQAKGTSLTVNAKATLRDNTVTTLDTSGSAAQIMYLENVISGAGAIRKTGAGALYFDAANTFSGGITIQQGIVNPYLSTSLGTGMLTFSGNGTLQVDAGNFSFANKIAINPGITGTVEVGSGKTLTLSGAITGEGALTKTSTGTLKLSGVNTYTGTTTIAGGTLTFANTSALYNGDTTKWTASNLVVGSGATAAFNVGGANEFTAANLDAVLTLTGNGGFQSGASLGLDTTNAGGNFTYSGAITDMNGGTNTLGLLKLGTGTLTLSGVNTYTGTTTVSAGTLLLASNTALGSLGTLNLAGGTLGGTGSARSLTNAVTFSANSTLGGDTGLTFTGALTNSGGNRTLTVSNAGLTTLGNLYLSEGTTGRTLTIAGSGDIEVTGVIANRSGTGTNASSLTKTSTGALTLSGTNTYTGTTTLSAGILIVANNNALGASTLSLNGGTLRGDGTARALGNSVTLAANSTIGGASDLTFTGNFSSSGASRVLSISNTGTTTFAGSTFTLAENNQARTITINNSGNVIISSVITNGSGSGADGLTKNGAGSLTLAGASTYTGATIINAGALFVNGSLANTAVTVAGGSLLGGSGSIGGLTTIRSGATLSPGNSAGTLTFNGGLRLEGGSAIDLELGSTSDLIYVSSGTLSASGLITVNLHATDGFSEGVYTLIHATGATLSNIDVTSFQLGTTIAGYDFSVSQVGQQFVLTASAVVPEPGTLALLAGLLTLAFAAYRRRHQ